MGASLESLVTLVEGATAKGRMDIWLSLINRTEARHVLELGVFQGAFAEEMLRRCPTIEHYVMLDPWRSLDEWNKPSNVDQQTFDAHFALAMSRTDFASHKRVVLRGKTMEVIDRIDDQALDVAYIDGDHTLRGIAIDLIATYPKVRPGGILGGDDYTHTIWQHAETYEPTLVCPFAAYFAESQRAPLVILPFNQFAIIKPPQPGDHFRVVDCTSSYGPRSLLPQVARRP